jgi:hypothetical protein
MLRRFFKDACDTSKQGLLMMVAMTPNITGG